MTAQCAYMYAGDPDSGPHIYTAGALQTEPFSSPRYSRVLCADLVWNPDSKQLKEGVMVKMVRKSNRLQL